MFARHFRKSEKLSTFKSGYESKLELNMLKILKAEYVNCTLKSNYLPEICVFTATAQTKNSLVLRLFFRYYGRDI